ERSSRIIEGDIDGELGERFDHSDAVLRVPHLHPNIKTLNWHRHGSMCTNPANSATCQRPTAPTRFETRSLPALSRSYPRHFTFHVAHPVRSIQRLERTGKAICKAPSRTAVAAKEAVSKCGQPTEFCRASAPACHSMDRQATRLPLQFVNDNCEASPRLT